MTRNSSAKKADAALRHKVKQTEVHWGEQVLRFVDIKIMERIGFLMYVDVKNYFGSNAYYVGHNFNFKKHIQDVIKCL